MSTLLMSFLKLLVIGKIIELALAGIAVTAMLVVFIVLFVHSLIKKRKY